MDEEAQLMCLVRHQMARVVHSQGWPLHENHKRSATNSAIFCGGIIRDFGSAVQLGDGPVRASRARTVCVPSASS
jgi:hypothetical protein